MSPSDERYDEWLRAAPGVVAVGDVAAWWSRRYNTRMRVEHWDDASTGPGVAVAALLAPGLGEIPPHDPVPYFWSDQLGHKLQYAGRHTESDHLVWREREDGSWTALWLDSDNHLSAALIAAEKLTASRISPIMMMSGSCLKTCFSPWANESVSSPISRCSITD